MAQNSNQPLLWKFTAWLLVVAGIGFFVLYVLHELTGFSVAATATTLAYYAFASFGAAMIGWGLLLLRAAADPALRDAMAMPTAIGFLLLAGMRVIPLFSGSGALDIIPPTLRIPITAGEVLLFGFLAYAFWKNRKSSGSNVRETNS
jgi:fumarate reductase subunit D